MDVNADRACMQCSVCVSGWVGGVPKRQHEVRNRVEQFQPPASLAAGTTHQRIVRHLKVRQSFELHHPACVVLLAWDKVLEELEDLVALEAGETAAAAQHATSVRIPITMPNAQSKKRHTEATTEAPRKIRKEKNRIEYNCNDVTHHTPAQMVLGARQNGKQLTNPPQAVPVSHSTG